MGRSASRAARRASTPEDATTNQLTDGEILWRSGSGRVLRIGDVVRVDGLRGRFRIPARQSWPGLITVFEMPRGTLGPDASPRYVRPERIHVRRAATAAMKEG